MREIKFRGYYNGDDITGQEPRWLYGDLYHRDSGEPMIREPRTANFIAVTPDTVGQYTGLKDRDCNEIYEGDILQGKDGFLYKVLWDVAGFICEGETDTICLLTEYLDNYVIIGNIHDNPELLNPNRQ